MPYKMFPTIDAVSHVSDVVARQVVEQLLRELGIYEVVKNNLHIKSDRQVPSSSFDVQGRLAGPTDRCQVEVEPVLDPLSTPWDSPYNSSSSLAYGWSRIQWRDQDVASLVDAQAGLRVVEHTVAFAQQMTFTFDLRDKNTAIVLMSAIRRRYDDGVYRPHDLSYHYPIDRSALYILLSVYKLRSSLHATYPKLIDYLKAISFDGVDLVTRREDIANNATTREVELVLHRTLLNCIGQLSFKQARPDAMMLDDAADRFTVSFTYTLQMGRPGYLRVEYPIFVENKFLQLPFKEPEPSYLPNMQGLFQSVALNLWWQRVGPMDTPFLVRLPSYDDFMPVGSRVVAQSFTPLVIAAFALDEQAPTSIMLKSFSDIKFHEVMLEIIHLQGADTFLVGAIFNIAIYANGVQVDPSCLRLDEDLTVWLAMDNPMLRYHIVLSEQTDVSKIDAKWWWLLWKYRWFFPSSLRNGFDYLIEHGLYTINPSDDLVRLIARCMRANNLSTHLLALIAAGHTDASIYQATATAAQFADYICLTRSRVSGKTLYEELVVLGIEAGCIDPNNIPGPYGEASGPSYKGNSHGFNTPLRVWNVVLTSSR